MPRNAENQARITVSMLMNVNVEMVISRSGEQIKIHSAQVAAGSGVFTERQVFENADDDVFSEMDRLAVECFGPVVEDDEES